MKKIVTLALSLALFASMNACSDSDTHDNSGNDIISQNNSGKDDSSKKQDDKQGKVDGIDVDISSRSMLLVQPDASCEKYRKHVLDGLAVSIADELFYRYRGPVYEDGEVGTNQPKDVSGAGEYTTTNLQEIGVDELDTVKNDGNYMYTIHDNQIHVSKIWPANDIKTVAVIDHASDASNEEAPDASENESPMNTWYSSRGIFLTDDKKLIEIGHESTWSGSGDYSASTSVRVYDVSNPEAPKLIKKHQIDGSFVDARLIDNRLHLVSSAIPGYDWYDVYKIVQAGIPGVPKLDYPWDADGFDWSEWSDDDRAKWREIEDAWFDKYEENKEKYLPVIRAWLEENYKTMDDVRWPKYSDGTASRDAIACSDLYVPSMASRENGFLLISEISGDDYANYKATAIADSGWTVYASQKNLYVASVSYNWYWSCAEDDCDSYTHIHHFALGDDAGQVRYVNSAEIKGIADNSFYYSEYQDHLRVVSGSERWWWSGSEEGQRLSILDIQSSKVMNQTAELDGFGMNESIRSVRMVGDRGYVVTFRQIDPLFVFDLSDPANPKKAGELEVNGFSSYIHPVDANHIITVGRDDTEDGVLTGIKLDLYDVSDPANPTLKYTTKVTDDYYISDDHSGSSSDSWSEALDNHHAFQYHAGSGLLAIPVNINKWHYSYDGNDWNYDNFSGMFVYRVKPDSDFTFVGGIDHSDLVPKDAEHWWTSLDRSRFYFKTAGEYDKDAYIYTISNHGIKVSDANHPDDTVGVLKYDAIAE